MLVSYSPLDNQRCFPKNWLNTAHPEVQTTWLLPSRCLQRVAAASTRQTHAYYNNAAKHASCHSTRAKAILPPGGKEKEQ